MNDHRLPLVVEPEAPDLEAVAWAQQNRPWVEDRLSSHGGVLFRRFDLGSIAEFERFARALCSDLYSEYGDLPREQEGKQVYQSTPYPADQRILFHNEAAHTPCWPMRQLFYSVVVAQKGGETPIVDCRAMYEALPCEIRSLFADKGLLYVRHFVDGFDVSWQDFFSTESRAEVEKICRENGTACEWTREGFLRTSQSGPGTARHPRTGDHVFFNQIQLHHPACLSAGLRRSLADLFGVERLPRNVSFGDGTPIDDAIVEVVNGLYDQLAVSFPWEQGDVLMVDNMLTAHSRNTFVGPRKVAVAMGEICRREDLES
ncbi:MAG TPA: TauD/TfdA family dioxygenase [Thermoanaerobaculia bacterium]